MKTTDIPVIEMTGDPRQRGQIYGESTRQLIANVVENWRSDLGCYGQTRLPKKRPDINRYLDDFFKETHYLSRIEKSAPHILEEVKGIAEGANQAFSDILGIQLIDEEWIYGLLRNLPKPTNKCTAFALPNQLDGVSYAGQNMDIPSWSEGNQVLLRVIPHQDSVNHIQAPEALIFSLAGNIGLNGLNASGLGVTCNTLSQLKHSTHGLPVAFIVRLILEKNCIDEAEQLLSKVEHASGQNYIISSRGDMRCFECCGTSVTRYSPQALNGRIFHSNHPLENTDKNDQIPVIEKRQINTVARLNSIRSHLGDVNKLSDLDDIKVALSAHDDPRNPVSRVINKENNQSSIGYTAGASIYEFGDSPKLHLAAGPPCETAFETFKFNNYRKCKDNQV